jgi:hypothetical protein
MAAATSTVRITKCPPGAAHGAVLDEYVHERSTQRLPVSATFHGGDEWESPGLDFADYQRCGTTSHKLNSGRKSTPPSWAQDDKKLRSVLVRYIEVRAGLWLQQTGSEAERLIRAETILRSALPRCEATLTQLSQAYVRQKNAGYPAGALRRLAINIENLDTVIRFNNQIAAKVLMASHLYFRCGLNSQEVSDEIGMKPPHVRVLLHRMRAVAWQLGFGEKPKFEGKRESKAGQAAGVVPSRAGCVIPGRSQPDSRRANPELRAQFENWQKKRNNATLIQCKHGHPICVENAHVGDMRREARYTCNICWKAQNARYMARKAAERVAAAAHS